MRCVAACTCDCGCAWVMGSEVRPGGWGGWGVFAHACGGGAGRGGEGKGKWQQAAPQKLLCTLHPLMPSCHTHELEFLQNWIAALNL